MTVVGVLQALAKRAGSVLSMILRSVLGSRARSPPAGCRRRISKPCVTSSSMQAIEITAHSREYVIALRESHASVPPDHLVNISP
jgi:hypothetical protein